MSLQNASDSHQTLDLKSTSIKPLTYGKLEASNNTTTKLNCNVEMNDLNIAENATVTQSGKVTNTAFRSKKVFKTKYKR